VDETKSEILPGTKEMQVITLKGGMKIGMFGICTEKTVLLSKPAKETYFEDAW
jgi:hypothetical protein